MRIREGEGRQRRGGGCWCRWFEMAGRGRDGICWGSWDIEMGHGGDGIQRWRWYLVTARGGARREEWEYPHRRTYEVYNNKAEAETAIDTHTHSSHITHPLGGSKANQKKKKDPLATYKIYINTPPLHPSPLYLDLPPHNPLLNSSPNTNIPYVASADSATGIGLRPLSARGIDDPPRTTDASSASSTPRGSEFWMRRPPRASGHSNISFGKVGRGEGGGWNIQSNPTDTPAMMLGLLRVLTKPTMPPPAVSAART